MTYVPNVWADGDPTKPLSAQRMTKIETGIKDAHAFEPRVAALEGAIPGFFSYKTTNKSVIPLTSTITAIPDLASTITVAKPTDRFRVDLSADLAVTAAANYYTLGYLAINGVRQTKQLVWNPGSSGACRWVVTQWWYVTDIPPGTVTFQIQFSATGTVSQLYSTHSELLVQKIS